MWVGWVMWGIRAACMGEVKYQVIHHPIQLIDFRCYCCSMRFNHKETVPCAPQNGHATLAAFCGGQGGRRRWRKSMIYIPTPR